MDDSYFFRKWESKASIRDQLMMGKNAVTVISNTTTGSLKFIDVETGEYISDDELRDVMLNRVEFLGLWHGINNFMEI